MPAATEYAICPMCGAGGRLVIDYDREDGPGKACKRCGHDGPTNEFHSGSSDVKDDRPTHTRTTQVRCSRHAKCDVSCRHRFPHRARFGCEIQPWYCDAATGKIMCLPYREEEGEKDAGTATTQG